MYESDSPDPTGMFQVYMVLAIAATVLSQRLRISLPAEGYCAFAMQYFDQMCIENSINGIQSLLLLLIFTLHCPSMKLNAWYLNYQCIAALIDVGLQREISGISLLEQEMRTRIFWVVFSLDRTIATMMGRPIGLRDEACELRLPQDIGDDSLASCQFSRRQSEPPSQMTYSIHLFELAKLNSEIKYVANSIVREAPSYAYPNIIDIHDWQSNMLRRLDQWATDIPRSGSSETYIELMCNLRYHSLRMVLLRPSPAIPSPSVESLKQCHHSALSCLRLFDTLYKKDLLVHNWITFHSLIMSIITMFYCIWNVAEIARTTELDVLISDVRVSLSMLSAAGEHWPGAKRSRDILEEISAFIIRRTMKASAYRPSQIRTEEVSEQSGGLSHLPSAAAEALPPLPLAGFDASASVPTSSNNIGDQRMDTFDSLTGAAGLFNQDEFLSSIDMDNIMLDMFEDFITPIPYLS
ncbi:Pyrimidine pathway regulatory protein 1 [Lasiodiplodia theobromae]|uniref:Pyrimidine pathway regulatory protein 1 n=1 Tax=Lasiodiplodia theobromae TaxID=45133 RepID=A0A5N5CTL2_9PEZI|nr:Pyrimidine pathway regulatory protein 1 [Lasiodiplodia theobromae]